MTARVAYRSVVLDADSTIADVEGIDWLAALRGPAVAEAVRAMTERAMAGDLPLEAVYGERLSRIAPTRDEVAALGAEYVRTMDPDAPAAARALREAGVRVSVVSGGLHAALLPMTRALGVADADVHAVHLRFDAAGRYAACEPSPLTGQRGKATLVAALALPRPTLAVGDGATDLAMRPAVDAFAAFTRFTHRAAVVAGADLVLPDFGALVATVIGPDA